MTDIELMLSVLRRYPQTRKCWATEYGITYSGGKFYMSNSKVTRIVNELYRGE